MLLKPPAWRRDRVQDLLDAGTAPIKKFEDKKTLSAYNFYKQWVDADTRKHLQLERNYPNFTGAIELHSRTDLGFRWYIEAAIMASIDAEVIAEDLGLPVAVIETYEDLFFDVRPRLTQKDYVVSMIFFPAYRAGIHGRDFDTLWKMMAYNGSFDVVRDFNSNGELSQDTRTWIDTATRAKLAKNAFLAAQVVTPNQYNSTEIIDSYVQLLKIEKEEQRGLQPEGSNTSALESLFTSIGVTVADIDSDKNPSEPRYNQISLETRNPLDDGKETSVVEPSV